MNQTRTVVLTGAWGGGKSSLMRELLADPAFGEVLTVIPEAAPLVRSMGFEVTEDLFEKRVVMMQHALERVAGCGSEKGRLVVTHRGSLDAWAFWCLQGRDADLFFQVAETYRNAELARYHAVLMMESTAGALPAVYADYTNHHNRPDAQQARCLETILMRAWQGHPRFFRLGNENASWSRKSYLARQILQALLPQKALDQGNLNQALANITYPSNHQYRILGDRMEPAPSAALRLRELEAVLPDRQWKSLIDVGCAKGMFLLWAALRYPMQQIIGVEAAGDMADACRKAAAGLGVPATIIKASFLETYPSLPPAELVLVLHCYQYLFFGSVYGTPGFGDHARIFRALAEICTHTLIFANPLELTREKQAAYSERGVPDSLIRAYNRDAILTCAAKYFELSVTSMRDTRPYIRMKVK